MPGRAGNGYQNIRRVEDQAIAKADREMKRKFRNHNNTSTVYRPVKENDTDDVWRYKMVNGKWELINPPQDTEDET